MAKDYLNAVANFKFFLFDVCVCVCMCLHVITFSFSPAFEEPYTMQKSEESLLLYDATVQIVGHGKGHMCSVVLGTVLRGEVPGLFPSGLSVQCGSLQ